MRIAPDALPFDGFFHAVVIAGVGKGFLARHAIKVYAGSHVHLPQVQVKLAKKLVVEPRDGAVVLVECDGEQPGQLPATYEIVPAALAPLRPSAPFGQGSRGPAAAGNERSR